LLWGEGGEGREWDGEMEVVEGREEVRVRGLKEGEGVGAGRSCFLEFATSYIENREHTFHLFLLRIFNSVKFTQAGGRLSKFVTAC